MYIHTLYVVHYVFDVYMVQRFSYETRPVVFKDIRKECNLYLCGSMSFRNTLSLCSLRLW